MELLELWTVLGLVRSRTAIGNEVSFQNLFKISKNIFFQKPFSQMASTGRRIMCGFNSCNETVQQPTLPSWYCQTIIIKPGSLPWFSMFHQQDASGGLGLLGHAQSPVARFLLLTFLNRAVFGSQDASHARVDNIALVLSPLPIMARTAWDPPTLSEAFVQILRWQALSFVSCFLKIFFSSSPIRPGMSNGKTWA